MTRRQQTAAAAFEAGRTVRAKGRALTAESIYRNPKLADLIRCAGWPTVWGSAVQGWAAENRARAVASQGQAVGHE